MHKRPELQCHYPLPLHSHQPPQTPPFVDLAARAGHERASAGIKRPPARWAEPSGVVAEHSSPLAGRFAGREQNSRSPNYQRNLLSMFYCNSRSDASLPGDATPTGPLRRRPCRTPVQLFVPSKISMQKRLASAHSQHAPSSCGLFIFCLVEKKKKRLVSFPFTRLPGAVLREGCT